MESMFSNCIKLEDLDVSGFKTAMVTNMANMFNGCFKQEILDVSGFITANVTNMSHMFMNCSKVKNLDLSGFNTAQVTDMSSMFLNCSTLTSLDLNSFTFNEGVASASFLKLATHLQTLVIPATAVNLDANACENVGTQTSPCTLVYPSGFTPEKTEEGTGWYKWKGGYFCSEESFLLGDVNHDGGVTVTDVTLTVDYVLGKNPSPFFIENADASVDGVVTVTDVTVIVNIVLGKNASHTPATAREATMDRLRHTTDGSH